MHTQAKLNETGMLSRRNILKKVGLAAGAMGALALVKGTTAAKAGDNERDDDQDHASMWLTVVSAPDNSFPSFKVFEVYGGGGMYIGSGQPDLTPAALSSAAWGIWKRVGQRKLRVVGRYWTYNPDATPSGFIAFDVTVTVSLDGKTSHAEGPGQFFDNDGNPLGPPFTFIGDGIRITFP